tara:strand:+ start:11148 stop:11582 length:435 start_codon:yes stop_codon:yes gene_type:complete
MEIKVRVGPDRYRTFHVARMANLNNLIYIGTYSKGFGGLVYLDIRTGHVVLVPNEVVETPQSPKDIKTIKADKGDRVLVVKPVAPLDLTVKGFATHWGCFETDGETEWGYGNPDIEKDEESENTAEKTTGETETETETEADEAF